MVYLATYDQVVTLIRLRTKVVVLLYQENDSLSTRSLSSLKLVEGRFSSRGYRVFALPISVHSSHYEETSCVRVPQLRIFEKGRCRIKHTGLLSYEQLQSILTHRLS